MYDMARSDCSISNLPCAWSRSQKQNNKLAQLICNFSKLQIYQKRSTEKYYFIISSYFLWFPNQPLGVSSYCLETLWKSLAPCLYRNKFLPYTVTSTLTLHCQGLHHIAKGNGYSANGDNDSQFWNKAEQNKNKKRKLIIMYHSGTTS